MPRSRSTSPPSSSTNTSPCSNGDMVPASVFKYGSILIAVGRIPALFSSTPRLDAVTPFPSPLRTPPETMTYFISHQRDTEPAYAVHQDSHSRVHQMNGIAAEMNINNGTMSSSRVERVRLSSPSSVPLLRLACIPTSLLPRMTKRDC